MCKNETKTVIHERYDHHDYKYTMCGYNVNTEDKVHLKQSDNDKITCLSCIKILNDMGIASTDGFPMKY